MWRWFHVFIAVAVMVVAIMVVAIWYRPLTSPVSPYHGRGDWEVGLWWTVFIFFVQNLK